MEIEELLIPRRRQVPSINYGRCMWVVCWTIVQVMCKLDNCACVI